ncbi:MULTISPECIES: PTS cellobiose transporter subunit IIC [Staphylococcus]|uniref:Permease IIC component n=1 Tax=Staphylococcus equorum TaxID=246432 RepID=A0AAP7LU39_9STAP|nr:PTS cellobiose transporter subunit IIC [Staphylococcus equorum]ANR67129.1 oligo-beta-mannoside permease IIC protein [Staphylococcus equorum]KKI53726.1 PTS system, cellobiose-specific IIC component [Staphylococcus equorum subsp. equorum]MCE5008073.1 PTS cellobiose transporter subunit IIC [Staphylococcus equorum]MCE5048374.1 PTS cellobiose transporter subunit IIC [Staphylococcus equorum]MCM3072485.1 PTS cellobiose transporter subunit IIC [Staphylococcus equorum]
MENKFMEKLEDILLPIADNLNNNKYLSSLRDGFMVALPLIIFGSIFIVIANFPFLDKILSESQFSAWQAMVGPDSESTLSIMGLYVIIGIGYKLTEKNGFEGIYGAVTALSSVLILTPQVFEKTEGVIPVEILGAKGMFLGIFVSIISCEIYSYLCRKEIAIKMPNGVLTQVAKSFSALIPISVTLSVILIVRILISFTPFDTLQNFIYTILQQPLTELGSGLTATIIAVLLIQIFWFFGLHGQIIVNTVFDPIWYSLNNENLEAFKANQELPNIITKQFIDTFLVGMGGTGGTMVVIILIFIVSRSQQNKEIGKLGAPASIFNVNEPILFGLPVIMNPIILVPWIIAPVVVTIITYFSMGLGLVPKPSGVIVPWTTPIFISGYLATGNAWQGAVLQLFNLIVTFLIWLPFFKVLDNGYFRKEQEKSKSEE